MNTNEGFALGYSLEDSLSKLYFYFFTMVDFAKENSSEERLVEIDGLVSKYKKVCEIVYKESNILQSNSFCIMNNNSQTRKLFDNDNMSIMNNSIVSNFNSKIIKNKSPNKMKKTPNVNLIYSFKSELDSFKKTKIEPSNRISIFNKPCSIAINNNLIAVGFENGSIHLYSKQLKFIVSIEYHSCSIYNLDLVAYNDEQFVISGEWSDDGKCIVAKVSKNYTFEIKANRQFDKHISCITNCKDNNALIVVVGLISGKIICWDFSNDIIIQSISHHSKEVRSILPLLSNNLLIISGGKDKQIKIWNYDKNLKHSFQFKNNNEGWINHIKNIANSELLASSSGNTSNPVINIWKLGISVCLKQLYIHNDYIKEMNYNTTTKELESISNSGSLVSSKIIDLGNEVEVTTVKRLILNKTSNNLKFHNNVIYSLNDSTIDNCLCTYDFN